MELDETRLEFGLFPDAMSIMIGNTLTRFRSYKKSRDLVTVGLLSMESAWWMIPVGRERIAATNPEADFETNMRLPMIPKTYLPERTERVNPDLAEDSDFSLVKTISSLDSDVLSIIIRRDRGARTGSNWFFGMEVGDLLILTSRVRELSKLTHGIPSLIFGGSLFGDMEVRKYIPEYRGAQINRTPDYIYAWKPEGFLRIGDMATNQSASRISHEMDFNSKMLYEEICRDCRNLGYPDSSLIIVMVTPIGVLTNVRLPAALASELQRGLMIANRINDLLQKDGFDLTANLDESSDKKAMEFSIASAAAVAKRIIDEQADETYPNIGPTYLDRIMNCSYKPSISKDLMKNSIDASLRDLSTEIEKGGKAMAKEQVASYKASRRRLVTELGSLGSTKEELPKISVFPIFKISLHPHSFEDPPLLDARKLSSSDSDSLREEFMRLRGQLPNDSNYLSRLWFSALTSAASNIDRFARDPTDHHEIQEGDEWVKKMTKDRNSRAKVNVDIQEEDWRELAKDGIRAKRFQKEPWMMARRKLKHRVIPPEAEVDHITDLVEGGFMDFFSGASQNKLWKRSGALDYKELLDTLQEGIYDKNKSRAITDSFIEDFVNSPLGDWSYVIHRIVEEVNFSATQNTKGATFILKKIDNLPIYLLVRPVSVDKHVFFSIMFDRKRCDLEVNGNHAFRQPALITEEIALFDFVSLNRHKNSHFLGTIWRLLPTISSVFDLLSVSKIKPLARLIRPETPNEIELQCCVNLLFLIMLDSSEKVSSDLQQLRYAYMKCVGLTIAPRQPLLSLSKLSSTVRRTLQHWVHKRFITTFKMMVREPPSPFSTPDPRDPDDTGDTQDIVSKLKDAEREEKEEKAEEELGESQDDQIDDSASLGDSSSAGMNFEIESEKAGLALTFRNLISFCSLREVRGLEYILNVSYLGYFHNKDEVSNQASLQILRKILAEEIKLRKTIGLDINKIVFSDEVQDDYENHLYNFQFAVNCGFAGTRHLSAKRGSSWKNVLNEELIKTLMRKTIQEFATLKASAVQNAKDKVDPFDDEEDLLKKIAASSGSRRRALENILYLSRDLNFEVNPFLNFSKILEIVHDKGGVYADIFKKNQIGGTREIFILTMIDRLLINFTETVSRVICRDLDPEMMTKPDQKLMKSSAHFNKIAEAMKAPSLVIATTADSDDMTTWCQRFTMQTLMSVLAPFLEEEMLIIACAVANLHTRKRIQLPADLVKLYFKNPEENSIDDSMNELKNQLLGTSENSDLVEPRSRLLKNRSNFMQGICHFWSSLVHACFKLHMSELNQSVISSLCGKLIPDCSVKFERTDKVSSDDASTLKTIIATPSRMVGLLTAQDRKRIYMSASLILTLLSYAESRTCKALTIKKSPEKSTSAVLNYIEEFNSLWLVMNTVISPKIKFYYPATMLTPINSVYNRINTCFDMRKQLLENGGTILSASITGECQRLLHYVTMGSTSQPLLHKEFLTELQKKPCISLGLFPYEHERLAGIFGLDFTHYLLCSRVELYSKIESSNFARDDMEMNEHGLASVKMSLLLGRAKKYHDTAKSLFKDFPLKEARQFLESDPICYFRPSKTTQEAISKIVLMFAQPSSMQHFSYSGANKLYASAAYVLNRPVVSKRIYEEDGTVSKQKQSLIGTIRDYPVGDEGLSAEDLAILFPNKSFYESVHSMLIREIESWVLAPAALRVHNRFIKKDLPKVVKSAPVDLPETCKQVWFPEQFKRRVPKSSIESSWAIYKETFPWLRDSIYHTVGMDDPALGDQSKKSVSPKFTSFSSLSQFVDSLAPSYRSIKALTKGTSHDSIISCLRSLCKHSFTHDGKLVGKYVQKMEESIESSLSALKSDLIKISDLPISRSAKVDMAIKVCDEIDQLIGFSDLYLESKQIHTIPRTLKDVAAFLLYVRLSYHEGKNDILTSELSSKAFGTDPRPHFYHRQSYDRMSRRYVGPGSFSCTLDGEVYNFFIEDQTLKRIKTSELRSIYSQSKLIELIIKDLNLEMPSLDESRREIEISKKRLKEMTKRSRIDHKIAYLLDDYRIEVTDVRGSRARVVIEMGYDKKELVSGQSSSGERYIVQLDERTFKLCRITRRADDGPFSAPITVASIGLNYTKISNETGFSPLTRIALSNYRHDGNKLRNTFENVDRVNLIIKPEVSEPIFNSLISQSSPVRVESISEFLQEVRYYCSSESCLAQYKEIFYSNIEQWYNEGIMSDETAEALECIIGLPSETYTKVYSSLISKTQSYNSLKNSNPILERQKELGRRLSKEEVTDVKRLQKKKLKDFAESIKSLKNQIDDNLSYQSKLCSHEFSDLFSRIREWFIARSTKYSNETLGLKAKRFRIKSSGIFQIRSRLLRMRMGDMNELEEISQLSESLTGSRREATVEISDSIRKTVKEAFSIDFSSFNESSLNFSLDDWKDIGEEEEGMTGAMMSGLAGLRPEDFKDIVNLTDFSFAPAEEKELEKKLRLTLGGPKLYCKTFDQALQFLTNNFDEDSLLVLADSALVKGPIPESYVDRLSKVIPLRREELNGAISLINGFLSDPIAPEAISKTAEDWIEEKEKRAVEFVSVRKEEQIAQRPADSEFELLLREADLYETDEEGYDDDYEDPDYSSDSDIFLQGSVSSKPSK